MTDNRWTPKHTASPASEHATCNMKVFRLPAAASALSVMKEELICYRVNPRAPTNALRCERLVHREVSSVYFELLW